MSKISSVDIENLEIIRRSVSDFILEASSNDKKGYKVLDIAPQDHNGAKEFFQQSDIATLDINPNSTATFIADICDDNSEIIPSNHFDLIICTEVLEHTLNPFKAVDELYRILKPGGSCYITTPFDLRIHGPLPDCWRFTEHGLRELFKRFETAEIRSIENENRFLMPIHYKTLAKK
jgi:SAM-dependent methyltransferase